MGVHLKYILSAVHYQVFRRQWKRAKNTIENETIVINSYQIRVHHVTKGKRKESLELYLLEHLLTGKNMFKKVKGVYVD